MVKGSPHSKKILERYARGERYSKDALESMRLKRIKHFLARAEIIHGDKFSYPDIDKTFVRAKIEIPIQCSEHGLVFKATPDNHLVFAGGKCPKCGKAAKSRSAKIKYHRQYERWLKESLPEHLSLLSDFVDPNEPVKVLCLIHNREESHKPIYLKNNKLHGCAICAEEAVTSSTKLTVEKVLKDVDLPENLTVLGVEQGEPDKHGHRHTRVICSCDKHGIFKITKGSLKRSNYRCQDCASLEMGYVPQRLGKLVEADELGKPCHLALMKVKVFGVTSLKLGVTTRTLKDRYKDALVEIFTDIMLPERLAYTIEKTLLDKFWEVKDTRIRAIGINKDSRWAGDTELFSLKEHEAISFALKQEVVKQKTKFNLVAE